MVSFNLQKTLLSFLECSVPFKFNLSNYNLIIIQFELPFVVEALVKYNAPPRQAVPLE